MHLASVQFFTFSVANQNPLSIKIFLIYRVYSFSKSLKSGALRLANDVLLLQSSEVIEIFYEEEYW